MDPIISVKNFSKAFGKKKVIDNLSFDVFSGDVFAFLGANGSGKTTTIRCLFKIYEPTSGQLLINNKPYSYEYSSNLGYLPEERGLYISSKVFETLIYFGQLKGMTYESAKNFTLSYLERVDLLDKANEVIGKLSSGQQQKLQLGITIINSPKLLVLDEPTKGLDPVNRSLLLDILLDLNKSGSTIVFSTHQMEEVERIASRLLMIKNGKSVLYGELDKIRQSFGSNTIHIEFEGTFPRDNSMYTANITGHTAEVTPNENVGNQDILKFLIGQNITIKGFEINAPSLNDIFIKVSKD